MIGLDGTVVNKKDENDPYGMGKMKGNSSTPTQAPERQA